MLSGVRGGEGFFRRGGSGDGDGGDDSDDGDGGKTRSPNEDRDGTAPNRGNTSGRHHCHHCHHRHHHFCHLSFLILSAGEITSVRRMPNFSLTTTTSPWATSVPLTNTSSGSPAARSSSTTEPWLSCSRLRIGMRVRPTSIDSVTGTSRMTSRLTSRATSLPPVSCRSPNSAAR